MLHRTRKANAIYELVFAEGMAVDSVLTEQLTGLSIAVLVVTDSVGQHAGVEHDHLLESSSAGSTAA